MIAKTNHIIENACRNGYGRCGALSAWIPSRARCTRRVVSVPPFIMGQYFKALNIDKKEFVCPWCIGGGAKLWEWAANPQGAIFTLLLRKSDEGGGGDYYGYHMGCDEGGPIHCPLNRLVGSWAGDRVVLVGDYDSSGLWDQASSKKFRNISHEVVGVWNDFIEIPEKKLDFSPCSTCMEGQD